MELLQLKYFCDAAKTENFSKTAKKYFVPSSNVSQCMKRLEQELGKKLFIRTANRIQLSDEGKVFYDYTSRALALLENATTVVKERNFQDVIKICILTNRRIIMDAVEKFKKLNSKTIVEISHIMPEDSAEYDVIIADEDFDGTYTDRKLIVSEKFCLAIPNSNPLSTKNILSAKDLSEQNYISMNKESSIYKTTLRICNEIGFRPNVIIHSDDPFYVRKCVEYGLGVAVFPALSWKNQFSEKVTIKEFGNFYRNTYAYWKDGALLKKSTNEFLTLLANESISQGL